MTHPDTFRADPPYVFEPGFTPECPYCGTLVDRAVPYSRDLPPHTIRVGNRTLVSHDPPERDHFHVHPCGHRLPAFAWHLVGRMYGDGVQVAFVRPGDVDAWFNGGAEIPDGLTDPG